MCLVDHNQIRLGGVLKATNERLHRCNLHWCVCRRDTCCDDAMIDTDSCQFCAGLMD